MKYVGSNTAFSFLKKKVAASPGGRLPIVEEKNMLTDEVVCTVGQVAEFSGPHLACENFRIILAKHDNLWHRNMLTSALHGCRDYFNESSPKTHP